MADGSWHRANGPSINHMPSAISHQPSAISHDRFVPWHPCPTARLSQGEPDGADGRLLLQHLDLTARRDFGETPRQFLAKPRDDPENAAGQVEGERVPAHLEL